MVENDNSMSFGISALRYRASASSRARIVPPSANTAGTTGASGGKGAIARGRSSSLHPAAAPAAAEAEEDEKDIDAGIDFLKVRIRRDPGTKRHSEGPSPDMLGMSNGPGMAEDDAVRVIQKACTVRLKAQNHGFQAPSH